MRDGLRPFRSSLPLAILLGPFALWPHSRSGALLLLLLVSLLTALTQVGGLLLWLLIPILAAVQRRFRNRLAGAAAASAAFLLCHLVLALLLLPEASRWTGRQPPHLSHRDSRTVDLAFFYRQAGSGRAIPVGGSWPLGYWAFSGPRADEPRPCDGADRAISLRWDLDWLQPLFAGKRLDSRRSGAMLAWLADANRGHALRKLLLEPHLRARFGLPAGLVRFQGCHAARHDDHLHIALK